MRPWRLLAVVALACLVGADDDDDALGRSRFADRQLLANNPIVARIYDEVGEVAERQAGGLAAILAIAPFLQLALVAVFAVTLVTAFTAFIASGGLTASGRGQTLADWENDYSIWLEQLQKDLDEAWEEQ